MMKIGKAFSLILIMTFLCQDVTFGTPERNSTLRPPSQFSLSKQATDFINKEDVSRENTSPSFDMKRDVHWRLFQDINGLMLGPIMETLARKGVFTKDLFGIPSDSRWVAIKDIARKHKKVKEEGKTDYEENLGNVYGAFRSLALQNWVKMDSKNKDTEVTLTQQGWVAAAIVQNGYYREFAEAIRHMKGYHSYLRRGPPDEESDKALLGFKRRVEKVKRYTSLVRRLKEKNIENRESLVKILKEALDEEDAKRIIPVIKNIPDDIKIHVIQRVLVHIHVYLIGMEMSPVMVALGMPVFEEKDHTINEVEEEAFKLFKDQHIKLNELDEKKYHPIWFKSAFELLETQGIVEIDRETVRLTELGKEFIKRAPGYGVTTAYLPSCEVLEEMLFGDPDPLGIGEDKHINRIMDIWGSSGAHRSYEGKYSEETGEITRDGIFGIIRHQFHELPLREQALGFFVMGAGDGHLVADSLKYILKYTERGKHLDTHPLVIVSSDYNEASLGRERATLKEFENIEGVHIVVMWGDVTDAEKFNSDLQAQLKKLVVKRLDTEKGKFEKVDMSIYDASDFVHTEEFIPHERSLRIRDEVEAIKIIADAIKDVDRETLEEALKALGVEEIPEDKHGLEELVISQWQGAYVDSTERGRLIPGYVVAADLIEFMKRWARYAKHGIRLLELHTSGANEQYEEVPIDIQKEMLIEKTLSAAYWSTHWMSDQYIMPYAEYNLAMVLSRLWPQKTYLYPLAKTGTPTGVSLALYHRSNPLSKTSIEILAKQEWKNPGNPGLFKYNFDPENFAEEYSDKFDNLLEVVNDRYAGRYGASYSIEWTEHFLRYLGYTEIFTDTYGGDYNNVLDSLIAESDELLFAMFDVAITDYELKYRGSYAYFLRYPKLIDEFASNIKEILQEKRKLHQRKVKILIPGSAFGEELISWKRVLDTKIRAIVADFDEFDFELIGVEQYKDVYIEAESKLKYGFDLFSALPLQGMDRKEVLERLDLMLDVNGNLEDYRKSIKIIHGDISSQESRKILVEVDLIIMNNIMYQMTEIERTNLVEHLIERFRVELPDDRLKIIGQEASRLKELRDRMLKNSKLGRWL